MLTSIRKSSRSRARRGLLRPALILAAALILATTAGLAMAAGTSYDLISNPSVTVNGGAIFQYFDTDFADGTGNLKPFVRIQKNGTEAGYNTDGPIDAGLDTKTGKWTHPIKLSEIPSIDVGGDNYREFIADFNEADNGVEAQISIDAFELYLFEPPTPVADPANITGYPYGRDGFNHGSDPVDATWGMPAWYLNGHVLATEENSSGSGQGDLQILVPETQFDEYPECYYGSTTCNVYLVNFVAMGFYSDLYNAGGETPPAGIDPTDWYTTATFEEIAVREYAVLDVSKTLNVTYENEIDWTLTKSVTPASASGFPGDTASFDYEVTWTRSDTQANYRADGEIVFANDSGEDLTVASFVDTFNGGAVEVTCPSPLPFVVADKSSVTCTYSVDLGDDATMPEGGWTNLVEVEYYQLVGGVPGPTLNRFAEATDDTAESRGTSADSEPGTVTVEDDNGYEGADYNWSIPGQTESGSYEYSNEYQCPTDASLYTDGSYSYEVDNTASIVETDDSHSETVTVTCYLWDVSKTAEGSYDEQYGWDITKTVDPDSQSGFAGDTLAWTWSITWESYLVGEVNHAVEGVITVVNPAPMELTVDVADELSGGFAATVVCNDDDGGTSLTIAANGSGTCDYTAEPGSQLAQNTATATRNDVSVSNTVDVTWVKGDEIGLDAEISDSNNGEIPVDAGQPYEYDETAQCSTDSGAYGDDGSYAGDASNTATITWTGGSDSSTAETSYTCYTLWVSKDAQTTYTRTWDWTIEKSGDQTALILSPGQMFLVNYQVVVNATSEDSEFAVSGEITVENPASIDATLTGVADVLPGSSNLVVDCGVDFPYTLGAGQTLTCSYSADLPDKAERTNTATATLQNSPSGTTEISGSAAVTFSDTPTSEVDECIDVTDNPYGFLGTVCAGDAPETFSYSMYVGPYDVCGTYTFTNVASFETNDTGTTDSDNWDVAVDVPCEGSCTLTPGYWKTHSEYGPAPYDDTWALLPNGADTAFFLSGQSYYQALWTEPKGNAYYNLAHAYIAAELNGLNGADFTAAQAAFDQATTLLQTYTPAQIAALKGNNPVRQQFLSLAEILDQYNNGYIGPGHCSE